MKRLIMAVVAALALFSGPAQAKDKITIATEGAYPPWNLTTDNGKLDGFEIELAKDLCRRMDLEYTMVTRDWHELIPSLVSGRYDAVMAALTITAKREKTICFSRYYAAAPSVFIVPKESGLSLFKTIIPALTLDALSVYEKNALADLSTLFRGKTIGTQADTIQERFILKYLGDDVNIKYYDLMEDLEPALISGRIDAVLGAMSHWVPKLKTPGGNKFTFIGPRMTQGPFGRGVGVAVAKTDTALAERFSRAINAAIADGTIKRLAEKWFTFDVSAPE